MKFYLFIFTAFLVFGCNDKKISTLGKQNHKSDSVGWASKTNDSLTNSEYNSMEKDSIENLEANIDPVFTTEGSIDGFEIKHLSFSITRKATYEVRLLSSNPNLRFVFRENNLDGEAYENLWTGELDVKDYNLKLFLNADGAMKKEVGRFKLYVFEKAPSRKH